MSLFHAVSNYMVSNSARTNQICLLLLSLHFLSQTTGTTESQRSSIEVCSRNDRRLFFFAMAYGTASGLGSKGSVVSGLLAAQSVQCFECVSLYPSFLGGGLSFADRVGFKRLAR